MKAVTLDTLKRSAAIPSMPQVALRFLEIIHDPDFNFQELASVLSTDPGTASEVLRLANSSLFGVTRQITSLSQAMTLLGVKRVRSLVLGRYIVDSIDRKRTNAVDRSYFWRRSLCTAVLAARLADTLDPQDREEAFIAGLLADIGVILFDEAMPAAYRPVAEEYRPHGFTAPGPLEMEAVGVTHGQASAMVLDDWQLPKTVCEAVRWHVWEMVDDETPRLARIVGAADRIGKYLCETPVHPEPLVEDCQDILSRLDLSAKALATILGEIESMIEEFASVLRVDVVGSRVYQMIADTINERLSATSAGLAEKAPR